MADYVNKLTKDKLVTGTRVKPGSINYNKDAIKSVEIDSDTLEITVVNEAYTCSNTPDESVLNDEFNMTETLSDGVPVWKGVTYDYYMYRVNNGIRKWFISDNYATLIGDDILAISDDTDATPPINTWYTNPTGGVAPIYVHSDGSNTLKATEGAIGPQGSQGPQGDKGDTGADSTVAGPQGVAGTIGTQGPQGETGIAGTTGETGTQGVQGSQGLPSEDVEVTVGGFLYENDKQVVVSYMFTDSSLRKYNDNKIRNLLGRCFHSEGLWNEKYLYVSSDPTASQFGGLDLYVYYTTWRGWVLTDGNMNAEAPDYDFYLYSGAGVGLFPPDKRDGSKWLDTNGEFPNIQSISGINLAVGEQALSAEVLPMPTLSIDIAVSDWSAKQATKTAKGVTPTAVLWVSPAPDSYDEYGESGVRATGQALDSITLTCTEVPTKTVTASVVIGEDTDV